MICIVAYHLDPLVSLRLSWMVLGLTYHLALIRSLCQSRNQRKFDWNEYINVAFLPFYQKLTENIWSIVDIVDTRQYFLRRVRVSFRLFLIALCPSSFIPPNFSLLLSVMLSFNLQMWSFIRLRFFFLQISLMIRLNSMRLFRLVLVKCFWYCLQHFSRH